MRSALQRLDEALDRIRSVADDMDRRMLRATPAERDRDETVRCSCTVIVSGFFESFLKDTAEGFISIVSQRRLPFTGLPPRVQSRHFEGGGWILGEKAKGQALWTSADQLDIAKRLASPAVNAGRYTLLWEAYADTRGNPGPNVVKDFLVGLGVEQAGQKLDRALNGTWAATSLALRSFIDIRNECAHTGYALTVPTTGDLRRYADLIHEIATAVVSILESRLGEHPFGVNLNRATAQELRRVPGLGPARISALIRHRTANGPLSQLQDIVNVPGFSERLVDALAQHAHV